MKHTQKITSAIISLGAVLALLVGVAASAATLGVNASVSANVGSSTVAATTTTKATSATTQKIIKQGDSDIDARIKALNNLSARIGTMQNVSADEQAALSSDIQTNQTGLTNLKATIDAGGTATELKASTKSIFNDYRIFALVIPRGWLTASGDRIETIVGLMNTLSVKLQARITALQTAGTDVTTLQANLTDMNAKTSDAQAKAQLALSGIANLAPDQGNATVAASNKAALVAARANIKTATTDLQTARKDVNAILKVLKIGASVTSSTTVKTTTAQ